MTDSPHFLKMSKYTATAVTMLIRASFIQRLRNFTDSAVKILRFYFVSMLETAFQFFIHRTTFLSISDAEFATASGISRIWRIRFNVSFSPFSASIVKRYSNFRYVVSVIFSLAVLFCNISHQLRREPSTGNSSQPISLSKSISETCSAMISGCRASLWTSRYLVSPQSTRAKWQPAR